MAIQLYSNVPAAASSIDVSLPVYNWDEWRTESETADTTVLVRTATGLSYPNKIKFEAKMVKDVYNNTPLQTSAAKNATRSGVNCYAQIYQTWSKKDPLDETVPETLIPAPFVIQFRPITDPLVTVEFVRARMLEAFAAAYENAEALMLLAQNPKLN